MGYCALLIPQKEKKETNKIKLGLFESVKGKLMSGLNDGGLNFENATTVLKNTANLISNGTDTVGNKFSGIALTQLLTKGKITNKTAYDYLTQGFPKAIGLTSVSMGFQSVEQLKTSLKNGVNVQQFVSSFQNFGNSLSKLASLNDKRKNVEGFEIIEIDVVTSETRNYQSETPDRRVESGQTYQEFIHNIPEIISLECILQNGRRYKTDEFEDIIVGIQKRKVAINVILGDVIKEDYVITNFAPIKETMDGFSYNLELKKIQAGDVSLVSLENTSFLKSSISQNKLKEDDTKTEKEKSMGFFEKNIEMAKEVSSGWYEKIKNFLKGNE